MAPKAYPDQRRRPKGQIGYRVEKLAGLPRSQDDRGRSHYMVRLNGLTADEATELLAFKRTIERRRAEGTDVYRSHREMVEFLERQENGFVTSGPT